MTNYEMRAEFHRDIQKIEKAPLRDRQEARKEFFKDLQGSPDLVAERIGWLLSGHYGQGSYHAAREVLKNKRMNRAAWLTTTIAALEWQCPAKFAIEAWKKLSAGEKKHLDSLIAKEMKYASDELSR